MLNTQEYLELINQRGQKGQPLSRVFSNMLKRPELFLNAYAKIAGNKGALTAGMDNETADGTSLTKLDKLRQSIRDGSFKWSPVRREYIPKGASKRPLGIPNWKDRVVQEVIRVILEAYYEPQFSDLSHGFRPNRGCHTALKAVGTWKGTKWFIEGDIKGCFDNISHDILLKILEKDIKDNRFIKLIRQMLKAGYLEDWKYYGTYSGTPQGGIVSPILSNIYLNELDKFFEGISGGYNYGSRRTPNKEYYNLKGKARKRFKAGKVEEAKEFKRLMRNEKVGLEDDAYRRLRYIRYADDFLLGFIGSRQEAVMLKELIKEFLETELDLRLSEEKTLITQASKKPARFLGYEITYPINAERPIMNGKPMFKVPKDVAHKWMSKYSEKGNPARNPKLLHNTVYEIITTYGAEIRGLYNYYQFAHNVGGLLPKVKWVMTQSLVRTLANKLRISQRQVYRKYKKTNRDTYSLEVESNGVTAVFGGFSFKRNKAWVKVEDNHIIPWAYYGRNELSRRLAQNCCEIPGCEGTQCGNTPYTRYERPKGKTLVGRINDSPPKKNLNGMLASSPSDN